MKHAGSPVDRKLFDGLILNCNEVSLACIQNSEQLKIAILYQVFFCSLFKSKILFYHEDASLMKFTFFFENYPENFKIDEAVIGNIHDYFIPEIYALVEDYISLNMAEYPVYLLVGFFYENLLARKITKNPSRIAAEKEHIKNNGIFYTPWKTAESFVEGLFSHLNIDDKKILNIKVLDLACGCGVFSILALKLLSGSVVAKIAKEGKEPEIFDNNLTTIARLTILKNNIYAVDNDETALEITRYSLLLFSLFEEKNIISLTEFVKLCAKLKMNLVKKDVIHIYKQNSPDFEIMPMPKFDVVISNPPYLSYYSRFSKANKELQHDLPLMKKNLKSINSEHLLKNRGRLNSIMFFLDYIIRSLSPDACLALLVDMNIHESLFSDIRKWILENMTLLEIRVNVRDFPGVNSGQSFVYLQNKKHDKNVDVKIYDDESREVNTIPQETLKKNVVFYMPKNFEWLSHLDNLPVLGKHCRITTGVNIGGASEFFLSNQPGDASFYPMITPLQLKHPYDRVSSKHDLFIDFNKKREELVNKNFYETNNNSVIALGKLERFLEPKIFVRQSAPRIIATYSEEAVVSPYSIFVINRAGNFNLYVLLALINSDLISYYCVKRGFIRQGSGKQPQIRKSSLQLIPVPKIENYERYKAEIEKYVGQIMTSPGRDDHNHGVVSEAKEEIEKLVCSMYEVDYSKAGGYRGL